jgi:hypothetical protein
MPICFEVNRWLADIRIGERNDQPVKVNAIRRKVGALVMMTLA